MSKSLAEVIGVFDTDTGALLGLAPASRLAQTYSPFNGATTFAALTDKATVDLPAINNPLATALNPTPTSISSMTALAATDNGKVYSCSTAFSTNVPNGLTPKPSTIFFPPATGNLTLTPTGGATINGSASASTRAFTGSNKLGVALIPNPYDINDYTLSGS